MSRGRLTWGGPGIRKIVFITYRNFPFLDPPHVSRGLPPDFPSRGLSFLNTGYGRQPLFMVLKEVVLEGSEGAELTRGRLTWGGSRKGKLR